MVVALAAVAGLLFVALAVYFWRQADVLARDTAKMIGGPRRTFVERWGYVGNKVIALLLVAIGVSVMISAAIR